ncbi:hypothetical protein [Armatimonas sp.]|uniref:hypothetical protein n=1 Tax=Armatimonas sp. TaxID=1872638 RepID=UPI00374D972C
MKRRVASWLTAITLISSSSISVAYAQSGATSMTIDITSPTQGQLFQWNPYSGSVTVNRHSNHVSTLLTLVPYAEVNYSIYMDQHSSNPYGPITIFASSGGTDTAIADEDGNLEISGELDSSVTYSGFSLYYSMVFFKATSILSANWLDSQNQSQSITQQVTESRYYRLAYQF